MGTLLALLLPLAQAADVFELTRGSPALGAVDYGYFGHGVAPAGDLDADGLDDVLAVAVNDYAPYGLLVLRGAAGGFDPTALEIAPRADYPGCCYGVTAVDMDGDGLRDVLVGRHVYDPYGYATHDVLWFRGDGVGVEATATSALPDAFDPSEQASWGKSIAGLEDLDGDGYGDLAVGADPYDTRTPGEVHIFRGGPDGPAAAATWVLQAPDSHPDFGYVVAAAGDVNGDGYSDLVVGNPHASDPDTYGVAYVYLGGPQGPFLSATLYIATASWEYGAVAAGAGDINGDGYDDVLVADPRNCVRDDELSHLFVYWGDPVQVDNTTPQVVACPDGECSYFADAVAGAGDVDGDGYAEVLVGNPVYYGADHALLYRGAPTGLLDPPLNWLWSDFETHTYGSAVSAAGDLDGDGRADLVVADQMALPGNDGAAQPWLGGPVVEGEPDTADPDTGDSGDTADSDDSGDTGDTAETGDSGDSDDDSDSGDSGTVDSDGDPETGADKPELHPACGCAQGGADPALTALLPALLLAAAARRRG